MTDDRSEFGMGAEHVKKLLEARLLHIHERMQWIADEEARAAWINGYAAQGHFLQEKLRLIEEAEDLVERLAVASGQQRAETEGQ